MTDLVFFYGTLMSGFKRPGRDPLDFLLDPVGRGWIRDAPFELGVDPAAGREEDSAVRGDVHRTIDPAGVMREFDEIEGSRPGDPDSSLYSRLERPATRHGGRVASAWTYFSNAPLGGAPPIAS